MVGLALLAILFLGVACDPKKSRTTSNKAAKKGDSTGAGPTFLASVPPGIAVPTRDDEVGWRVLSDYGAVLVARGGAVAPPFVVFPDAPAVDRWQASVKTMRTNLGCTWIELQAPAMTALM